MVRGLANEKMLPAKVDHDNFRDLDLRIRGASNANEKHFLYRPSMHSSCLISMWTSWQRSHPNPPHLVCLLVHVARKTTTTISLSKLVKTNCALQAETKWPLARVSACMTMKICRVSLDLSSGESWTATPWCWWDVGSRSSLTDQSRSKSFDMASRMLIGLSKLSRTRLSLVSMLFRALLAAVVHFA